VHGGDLRWDNPLDRLFQFFRRSGFLQFFTRPLDGFLGCFALRVDLQRSLGIIQALRRRGQGRQNQPGGFQARCKCNSLLSQLAGCGPVAAFHGGHGVLKSQMDWIRVSVHGRKVVRAVVLELILQ